MLFTWTSSRVCPRNRFGIYSSSITAHHSEHPPVVGLLKYPSAMAHTHEGVAASLEVESTVTESAICREKLSHATRAAVGDVPSNNSRLLIASGNKHWLPSARNFLRSNCFIIFIVILVALGVLVLFAAFRSTVIPQLSWGENQAILLNAAHDGLFTKFYKWTLTPENAKEAQRLAPMLMKFCFRKAAEPVSLLVTLSLVSSSRSSLPSPFDFSRASSRRLVYSSDHFSPAPPSLPFDQVYNPSSVLLPACDSCTKLISALPPSFSAQTIQSILPHDDQPACRAALATLAGGKTMVDISDRSRVARDDIADTRAVDGSLAADACRLLPERREAVREVDRQRRIRELIDKGVEDKGSSMNSEPISLKDGATREDLQIAAFKISFYIAPIDMFPSNRQAQAQKTSERIRSAAIPTTSGAFGEAWILENGNVDDETHGSAATQPVDMAGEDTETRQSINNETQVYNPQQNKNSSVQKLGRATQKFVLPASVLLQPQVKLSLFKVTAILTTTTTTIIPYNNGLRRLLFKMFAATVVSTIFCYFCCYLCHCGYGSFNCGDKNLKYNPRRYVKQFLFVHSHIVLQVFVYQTIQTLKK
eukprot:GHVT01075873.1.p1 GENE.GHVT01075873.1~~GHVT01075873.1.p1  ORF type:complete len:591 (+),score=39.57 GHVT01075873.1:57-1829(+)